MAAQFSLLTAAQPQHHQPSPSPLLLHPTMQFHQPPLPPQKGEKSKNEKLLPLCLEWRAVAQGSCLNSLPALPFAAEESCSSWDLRAARARRPTPPQSTPPPALPFLRLRMCLSSHSSSLL
uniref:Uncharacterized protein n=1 Tax=Dunaliella tertiolecta TaxID=3047 RepID=A0A7S3QPM8_DUNTE